MAHPARLSDGGTAASASTMSPSPDRVASLARTILDRCRGEGPANCVSRCPLGVDARAYVQLAKEGRFPEALAKVRERLPFPGILGYICAHPCEYHCKRVDEDSAVRIRDVKRFLAVREEGPPAHLLERAPDNGRAVAVVGGGPGGLLAAHDLCKLGYRVTIFEREDRIGGCLTMRIPEWRLPAAVRDRDLSVIEALGITVLTGQELGRDVTLDELRRDFNAVVLMLGFGGGQSFVRGAGNTLRRTIRGTLWVDPHTSATELEGVFAGGDSVSGPATVVEAMGMGRRAAASVHRFLLGAEPGNDPMPFPAKPLLWNLDISEDERRARERSPVMLTPFNQGLTEEEVVAEGERCLDCTCGLCVKDCEFLTKHCNSPKDLARAVLADTLDDATLAMAYSCNICALCAEVCPVDLDTGEMLLELRRKAVRTGVGPLPAHKPIVGYWKAGVASLFTLARAEPGHRRAKRLFFTGCALPAVAPQHTLRVYDELRRAYPGTGVLMYCCGAPVELLGMDEAFAATVAAIRRHADELGAEQLVAACPDCTHTLKEALPELDIVTAWELLAGVWQPPRLREGERVVFHDSCKARHMPATVEAVRRLVSDSGGTVEEIEYNGELARCCGFGGMIYPVDPELSRAVSKRRADESEQPMLTYCAGCRLALAGVGKKATHVLDFLLEDDWESKQSAPPYGAVKRYYNRLRTKWAFKRLGPLA